MNRYFLKMNDPKTQFIIFGPSRILQEIIIHGVNINANTTIRFISTVKNLGVHMDQHLTMTNNTIKLKKKSFKFLRNIARIPSLLSIEQLKLIVNTLVVLGLDYCNSLYYGVSGSVIHQQQLIQNAAVKLVTGKFKYDHVGNDLSKLHWLPIKRWIIFKVALLSYKCVTRMAPSYLQDLFQYKHHGHSCLLIVPSANTRYGKRSFSIAGPKVFNMLPQSIKSLTNLKSFKTNLKTYLFQISESEIDKLWI